MAVMADNWRIGSGVPRANLREISNTQMDGSGQLNRCDRRCILVGESAGWGIVTLPC